MDRVIVVGGGLAGVRAVEALRSKGYEGALTLVSAERERPYDRPPLSKAVLAGDSDDTTVDADWDALRCDLLLGERATALRPADPGRGGVLATTAGDLPFDGLVIATGATPVTLPGEGRQHVLRTIGDSRGLRSRLAEGARIVIVGAGWIGAEVATTAAKKGCRVTVVEAADTPLANAIGPEIGALTVPWYAEAGVELRTGVKVAAVEPDGLALAGGGRIEADEVVVGVGVRPEVSWLDGSGLLVERGVVTDGSFRVYQGEEEPGALRPDIVAVGDCAAWWSERYGRRLLVEHWDTALNAPDVAAAALLGEEARYDAAPYFWSEQFGRMVQYAGSHAASERLVHRGDPAGRKWAAVWLTGDRLDAILTVDRPRDLVQARRVIAAGTPVDPEAIADPDVPVRQAVRG
ncbi:3-phenylpropionate/trans-cinnamate dioxygenase ferredoxin reductase subunit [Actinomadura meyerae]|uniref:3-phenylpropionate/trans-cinnamate dioxygenase ferredoxin reductase subunit n=1 Tax=Actinomadura meyerae TaxID=240840 RepID=A0A239CC89_9ACTN|nr:FAD-dependent oxidoreductase [Actinomadura meyerae]SNS17856.1 3-phenylpropionate/trans-cinnamate dioxygenase ferredoxin reductase subunit [Actinomadura meyerae]